jgi:hypothetical protein
LAHAFGVIDVIAKDDGPNEVAGGLEKLGDPSGNEFGPPGRITGSDLFLDHMQPNCRPGDPASTGVYK